MIGVEFVCHAASNAMAVSGRLGRFGLIRAVLFAAEKPPRNSGPRARHSVGGPRPSPFVRLQVVARKPKIDVSARFCVAPACVLTNGCRNGSMWSAGGVCASPYCRKSNGLRLVRSRSGVWRMIAFSTYGRHRSPHSHAFPPLSQHVPILLQNRHEALSCLLALGGPFVFHVHRQRGTVVCLCQ